MFALDDSWTVFPDFVRDRSAGDFERFVRGMGGIASEPRLVPIGPHFPSLIGGEESRFVAPPGVIRPRWWLALPKRQAGELCGGSAQIYEGRVGGHIGGGAGGECDARGGVSAGGSVGGVRGSGGAESARAPAARVATAAAARETPSVRATMASAAARAAASAASRSS